MPRGSMPSLPPFLCGVLQSAGITAAFVAFGLASAGMVSLLAARDGAVEAPAQHSPALRPAGGKALPVAPLAGFGPSCVGIRTRHR